MSARPRTRLYIFWKNRSSKKIRKQKPLPPSLHSQTCQQRKGQFLWSWQKLLLMISEVDFINGFSILYIQNCGVRAFPSPLSIWCSRNSCQTRRILSFVGIMPTALWSAKEFQVTKNGSTVLALQRMPKKKWHQRVIVTQRAASSRKRDVFQYEWFTDGKQLRFCCDLQYKVLG